MSDERTKALRDALKAAQGEVDAIHDGTANWRDMPEDEQERAYAMLAGAALVRDAVAKLLKDAP